jgi:hypothetical protein
MCVCELVCVCGWVGGWHMDRGTEREREMQGKVTDTDREHRRMMEQGVIDAQVSMLATTPCACTRTRRSVCARIGAGLCVWLCLCVPVFARTAMGSVSMSASSPASITSSTSGCSRSCKNCRSLAPLAPAYRGFRCMYVMSVSAHPHNRGNGTHAKDKERRQRERETDAPIDTDRVRQIHTQVHKLACWFRLNPYHSLCLLFAHCLSAPAEEDDEAHKDRVADQHVLQVRHLLHLNRNRRLRWVTHTQPALCQHSPRRTHKHTQTHVYTHTQARADTQTHT